MEGALHDPRFGYYHHAIREVGPGGDFSTATTLHPALGRAVASWALQMRAELLGSGRLHLVEVGAGSGQLAESVLGALGPLRRRVVTYHIVDASPVLREVQRRRRLPRSVHWHETVQEALASAGGSALVFSNELVDAFPCHQVHFSRGRWREVYVTLREGRPVEVLGEFSDARLGSELCSLPAAAENAEEGQRFEIHLAYLDWLRGWLPALRRGAMLTIDYGAPVEELRRRGRRGSLRGYFKHLRIEGRGVYERFGRQDLTADVNFTDLRRWGQEAGLEHRSLVSQRDFVLGRMPRLARRLERDEALRFVLDEGGAGRAYLVLEQQRK